MCSSRCAFRKVPHYALQDFSSAFFCHSHHTLAITPSYTGLYELLPGLSHRIFGDVCLVPLSVFVFINLKLLLILPLTYTCHVETKKYLELLDLTFISNLLKLKFKIQTPLTFTFQLL